MSDLSIVRKRPRRWAERTFALVFSISAHVAVLMAFVMSNIATPLKEYDLDPIVIEQFTLEGPRTDEPVAESSAAPKKPIPPKPLPKQPIKARPAPLLRPVSNPIPPAGDDEAKELAEPAAELTGEQLAGARSSGGGGQGRQCDMVRYLERELQKDPRANATLAAAHPGAKAVLLWNGDWLRSNTQAGKGLAGVREAIMVEVAFAPEACKQDPVSGTVVLALADGPDAARVALGRGSWTWKDLLFAR